MKKTDRSLRITRARENNLKNVSLSLPHDQLTVVTGLSGSGKSSLAFDTVYAEGQRRYIETFSPYTRQFFDKVKKPDVDAIDNVRPAIAIQQRTRILSSRSTVGSLTNINDYLKLLWGALSTPVCPVCGIEFQSYTPGKVVDVLAEWSHIKTERTLLVCGAVTFINAAPVKKKVSKTKKKAATPEVVAPATLPDTAKELVTRGFSRFYNFKTNTTESFEDNPSPDLTSDGKLFVVLDRVRIAASPTPLSTAQKKRLRESIEQAFTLATQSLPGTTVANTGCFIIEINDQKAPTRKPFLQVLQGDLLTQIARNAVTVHEFPAEYRCSTGKFSIPKKRPALFSYNHPLGACDECKGFGHILAVDVNRCIPNPMLSLKQKAIQCWAGAGARVEYKDLMKFCAAEGISVDTPWLELPKADQDKVLHHKSKEYWGLFPWFKWIERKTYKMHVRVFLARYRSQILCPTCHGTRLKPGALAYQIDNRTLPDLWQMPVSDLLPWLTELRQRCKLQKLLTRPLQELFNALIARVQFLYDLGLTYLTLDRQARTLSGGETQRVNLAAALGSELISTQFVLDEPSVGLHPRDTERLIKSVQDLTDRGNSVLVVEHDIDFIRSADSIVEIGPQAGEHGGQIVYAGPSKDWKPFEIVLEKLRTTSAQGAPALQIHNATARNLKNVAVAIPLQQFVCLTGVSGSGKSTLVHEVLLKAFERHKIGMQAESSHDLVTGFENLDDVLVIDQSPLAKSPRANIGTYSGMWEEIRALLAATEDAHTRALSKSSFSFNVDAGRCPECKGAGYIREDMQFLSDVYIPCEVCLGKRFQQTVLEVRYKGKDVSELLAMSADACIEFFADQPRILGAAQVLSELGLGHLTLGHPLSELSGGEAQRLKLVPIIQQSRESDKKLGSLLIFDEPTTGLHHFDVMRLVQLLRTLVSHGHSVLCIEHNLTLIAASDWLIDLGPEGGRGGGEVLAQGTPAEFITNGITTRSYTARYLREFIDSIKKAPVKTKAISARPERVKLHESNTHLIIQGAREHNLKEVDVHVPLNTMVAITGVSGSGKSTIAKDIIYAEGQRRYLDCLSPYARQYIKELHKPDIDDIRNVKPTICVYQHTFQPSRLSTVATMSEIYNFLRLLYAKVGVQHCPDHPQHRIAPLSVEDIAQQISLMKEKSVRILAPVIKLKKGNHRAVLERAVQSEVSQVRVDGVFLNPQTVAMSGGLERNKVHSVDFVLGKFNPATLDAELLREVVAQALSLGAGTLLVHTDKDETVYSTDRNCPICKRGFFKPDPEDLSFNSRRGRCETCQGAGVVEGKKKRGEEAPIVTCPECDGSRLGPIGRNLRLQGKAIHEVCRNTASGIQEFIDSLQFTPQLEALTQPVLREIIDRAETLVDIGLDYLGLGRECNTLSNGELQRLRLATAMSSLLSGAMYIFDEPSAGLHPLENEKVLARLQRLRDLDNSILVIEHDSDCILACNHVVDVGPGGGKDGGTIVYEGALPEFLSSSNSTTAQSIRESISRVLTGHTQSEKLSRTQPKLHIKNGAANNISKLQLAVPLNALVSVAGVSGAGKSSLVHHIIKDTMANGDENESTWDYRGISLESDTPITRVLEVDQKPIGINSRSTPASYLKIWDEVRNLFAKTNEAQARGWTASFFSYNSGAGRCPECKGLGHIKLEMSFLPDAEVLCESCAGLRYGEDALSVRYLGLNVSDVLKLTFEEAKTVFANHRSIHQSLHLACELGLGYLTLGQSSTTLSGGESQRIKLVSELSGTPRGHTLYILDEPTTGLHKSDVARLMKILRELIARGNSVIVIEHDPDVIVTSDWVIEMGPGPGDDGGQVVYKGEPQGLFKAQTAWGTVLRKYSQVKPTTTSLPIHSSVA